MNSPYPGCCLVLKQGRRREETHRLSGGGGEPCDKSPWQPKERGTLVAIVTMRDLCSHMSTVAMVTVRLEWIPKGEVGRRGEDLSFPHNPPSKAEKKEMAGRGTPLPSFLLFSLQQRELEHICTTESYPWVFI